MEMPKVKIIVTTETGEELMTIWVRLDLLGHWFQSQGEQLIRMVLPEVKPIQFTKEEQL